MKYFSFKEFEKTNHKNIDNTIKDPQIKKNVQEFVENLLDPLRDGWGVYSKENGLGGGGIEITSGFRSPELNVATGGSATSAHPYGLAVDTKPVNGHMKEYQDYVKNFLKGVNFDQYIKEYPNEKGVASWIHIGYKYPKTMGFRKQFMVKTKSGYKKI